MNELFVQMIVSCAANMFENSEISRFVSGMNVSDGVSNGYVSSLAMLSGS